MYNECLVTPRSSEKKETWHQGKNNKLKFHYVDLIAKKSLHRFKLTFDLLVYSVDETCDCVDLSVLTSLASRHIKIKFVHLHAKKSLKHTLDMLDLYPWSNPSVHKVYQCEIKIVHHLQKTNVEEAKNHIDKIISYHNHQFVSSSRQLLWKITSAIRIVPYRACCCKPWTKAMSPSDVHR